MSYNRKKGSRLLSMSVALRVLERGCGVGFGHYNHDDGDDWIPSDQHNLELPRSGAILSQSLLQLVSIEDCQKL
jgi:hypothetical protein